MSGNNIFQEIEEDLERQKMEALWKRYSGLVIAGALAVVIGTGGITAWRSWNVERNQHATGALINIVRSAGSDEAKEIETLEAFAQKNHGDTQATFAQLHAAALAVRNGNKDKAIQIYNAVAGDHKADSAFRQLADLLAVQTQIDTGNPPELEKRLQPLLAENAPWRFTAMEYDGYLALRTGDNAKAKQIFTELSQDNSAPHSLGARAADMLRYVNE